MDKRDRMETRFSLNMTHLPNPIAESTCFNLNSSGRSSNVPKFHWGGSPISPKNRSLTGVSLYNASALNTSRGAANAHRVRKNLSKIDPRIYADVQSKGLASRIVQYHENGSRLNRSMSASNLYTKPGQFPVVNLHKTELPYRATQQNVSMTRIAPPEKSVFRGNTLSSLLRSNSVISLHKSNEEISCENRPILHPPATEGDLAPTRSVLDVLKEISRKRINSDDSETIHDTTKKYCSRDCMDAPSYETAAQTTDTRNNNSLVHPIYPTQSFKRQREPVPQHSVHSNYVGTTTTVTTNSTQNSPEQIAKKRLCSYNNDITSSLSSSRIHANKRKLYEQRSAAQRSPPSLSDEYESQRAKRQQSDIGIKELSKSLSCATPITPILDTPTHQNVEYEENKSTLDSRTVYAQAYTKVNINDKSKQLEKTQKPKLTLFNRNYDEETEVSGQNGHGSKFENDFDANDDCADIQFVKPKKSSSVSNTKNPFIERTQKSKLALMLSGLRGEIYQLDEDEVDEINPIPTLFANSASVLSNKINVTNPSVSTNITTTVVTSNENNLLSTTKETVTTTTSPIMAVATSPIVGGFKFTPPESTATAKNNNETTSTSATLSTAVSPSSVGFNFKPPASTATTNDSKDNTSTSIATALTIPTPAKTTSPLVGIKFTPQIPAQTTVGSVISASTPFSLSTNMAVTTAAVVNTIPQLQGFTSNALSHKTETIAPVTSTATTTSIKNVDAVPTQTSGIVGGFKFDAFNTTAPPTANIPENSAISFGSLGGSTSAVTTSSSNTLPTLSFGSSNITNTKPTINFGAATTVTAPTLNFGSTTTATAPAVNFGLTTSDAPSTVEVGDNTTASKPIPSNVLGGAQVNVFAAKASTVSTIPFTFGTSQSLTTSVAPTSTKASSNTFSFGTVNTTTPQKVSSAASYAFGAPNPNSTTAPNTTTAFGFVANTSTTSTASGSTPVFGFGSGQMSTSNTKATTASDTNTTSSNLFSFGSAAANTTIAPASSSQPKVFGSIAANTDTSQNTFAPKATTFSFGSSASPGANQQLSTSFGTTSTNSTPFTFGGNSDNKSAILTGGFTFGSAPGAAATPNSQPPTLFGSVTSNSTGNSTSTMAPPTNIVKPSFNFSGTTAQNKTDDPKALFGGITTTNVNGGNNTFGALATSNANQQNNTFSFGQSSESSTTNNLNIFGTPAMNKPSVGGFSFGATTTGNALNKPTATATTNTTPFTFGSSISTNSTNATFNFGSSNGATPANKPFSFGGNTSTSSNLASTGNIFGGSATMMNAANSTQSAATPFSLPTSIPNTATTAGPTPNLFAQPASMSTEQRRIRRATRRLQKT